MKYNNLKVKILKQILDIGLGKKKKYSQYAFHIPCYSRQQQKQFPL